MKSAASLICLVLVWTHAMAQDSGSLAAQYETIQWNLFIGTPVDSLLKAIGQEYKIYMMESVAKSTIVTFQFPYSGKFDFQVRLQLEDSGTIPIWDIAGIGRTTIMSIDTMIAVRVSDQYASDFRCLMVVLPTLRGYIYDHIRPILETQDPGRLDPALLERVRQSCRKLQEEQLKKEKP